MKTSTHFLYRGVALGAFLLGAMTPVASARADGGVVRLRAGDSSLVATFFAPADLSRDLAAELTVLVQDQATGEVVMNAEVKLQFTSPPGARMPMNDPWCRPPRSLLLAAPDGSMDKLPAILLSRAQSDNKLLQGASVVFPVAGDWGIQLIVRRGTERISQDGVLAIGMPSNRLAVVWPWLTLPPCLIGLFALNQRLKSRRVRAARVTVESVEA